MAPRVDVAFYLPWIGPLLVDGSTVPAGGAETQVYLLAHELARRGIHVALVTLPVDGGAPPDSSADPQIVIRSPSRGQLRYVGKLLEAGAVMHAVRKVKARVWVQRAAATDTGLVAIAARLNGRRFVYSTASAADFDPQRLHPHRRDRALIRAGMRLATRIVVQTPEQVHLCRDRFGRDPVLIRSAVEPAPRRTSSSDAFMWVGNLASYKRPFDFVDLAREVPEARFRMVAASRFAGDPVRAELESRAAVLPNLEILDFRPRAELLQLMDTAVAIVNTSEFEGMPNVFLEGWARGIPALALYYDPDGVIVREALGAYASGSESRFAEQSRAMWRERAQPSPLAERCRAYVLREHSLSAATDRWIEALELAPR
ncbi:MAG: glycosyltransferase family 4 protein [Solirubrobacteraceae bacterium]